MPNSPQCHGAAGDGLLFAGLGAGRCVAVRGVGVLGVPGAARAVGTDSAWFLSPHRAGWLTVSVPALAPGAGSPAVPWGCPVPQREETSLFPALVPALLSTTYRRGIRLPRHWKMLLVEGQPHRTGGLFLLSLARQGCIKRVFALLDAQNNSSFAPGAPGRIATSLASSWVLELLQSVLAARLPAGADTGSVCFPGCVRGRLAAPGCPAPDSVPCAGR